MHHDDLQIDTERLTLRQPTRDDFAGSLAMWSDADVTRFIGGRPFTHEETWARLLRYVGHWQVLGFGYWIVRERDTGRYVGEVGFADYQRDLDPPLNGVPEAGWAIAPHAHGKGYATEAVRAATRWADRRWPGAHTTCIVDPDNALSLRVAAKCGYVQTGRATYRGNTSLVFERPSAPV
ncbi:GNAT family N-acetyltransferase [Paraburkholderia phosphatilytica]|uniref:GNAT family N-acetyltransferase n=1 Tax=Paraburkholderia phosphatilytica TaxID=2282883 RepID=UPI000E545CEC|nr:GNAT family N-acetyltransferase [Paraburkholderia phosphatilytica]